MDLCQQRLVASTLALLLLVGPFAVAASAQAYDEPDNTQPGDAMMQSYLAELAGEVHENFAEDLRSLKAWDQLRPRYREEYLYMLGLWPLPEKTPLAAKVTGTLEGDGYTVEMLHYQSRPGLYVTCNLYRPSTVGVGQRLPAVLYVCGHSSRGRNGNKTAFQSHGIWFARHGYVCLVLDTLQLGEIAGVHHGTYREQRWSWHSRGYTPAGVECWNGVRGIDYLHSRGDVDPDRIAVTGISGGGAATFWIAAADERAQVAVPVSGMADLPSYVTNRVINGHCDCMFLYNTFRWPWARIAALAAPRPLLFVNSDQDPIFPMDANERVINRLERLYSLYGASDRIDAVVSIGGHAYRKDIRQAAYRFINTQLRRDPKPITDSEIDLVTGQNASEHAIAPERLRVFASDADIPDDQRNTTIDQYFVSRAVVGPPIDGKFSEWKEGLLAELRRVVFRWIPKTIPAARQLQELPQDTVLVETEPGIRIRVRKRRTTTNSTQRVLLVVQDASLDASDEATWLEEIREPQDKLVLCETRGNGLSAWTRKNPPNYVERSLALLGTTADTGRVRDVAAVARYLKETAQDPWTLHVVGKGGAGVLAAYAALLEPAIDGVVLVDPPWSHMDAEAPQLLNVLRVCDVSAAVGMLAPRWLTIHSDAPQPSLVREAYDAAGAGNRLTVKPE